MRNDVDPAGNRRSGVRSLCFLLIFSAPLFATVLFFISIKQAISGDCPIALDLNGNGYIDIRGLTTSQRQVYTIFSIPNFVEFDLNGGGKQKIDWILPNTDAFLLDLRRGTPPKNIDGSWLFANNEGYSNGFEKLAALDTNHDGELTGSELAKIGLWLDNGDAIFQPSELRSLTDYNITSLPTTFSAEESPYGGEKMVAEASALNRDPIYMEDVWFLSEPNVSEYDKEVSSLFNW